MNRHLLDAIAIAYDAVSALERRPQAFSAAKRALLLRRAADELECAWRACGLSRRDLLNHVLLLEDRGQAPDVGGDQEFQGGDFRTPAARPRLL
jgi:hypothetical protein